MSFNIILCGVGGQGTVLASKLIAASAMSKGHKVMSAETIGMAQKGGSVFSYIKIGDDAHSPLTGKGDADLIIGFEPAETVRMTPYLRRGGSVITSTSPVMPVTAALAGSSYSGDAEIAFLRSLDKIDKLVTVDTMQAASDIGNAKTVNMVLLGAAVRSGLLGDIDLDDVIGVMKKRVKPQFVDLNIKALSYAQI